VTSVATQRYFSENYYDARKLLRATAKTSGFDVTSHTHPISGPNNEALSTDIIFIGEPDTENLIVLISGTHGVETLCGSACQSAFLATGEWQCMPANTSVLVIHALNCWGAAHLRRNNEDNVDLARNFLDFNEPIPKNVKYEKLRAAIDCKEFRGPERDYANRMHAEFLSTHSINDYVDALMGGQYQYAEGFAYGGHEAVWSNRLLKDVLTPFSATAKQIRVVEYHSGLGPYGYGSAVTMQTGEDLERVRSIYGRWVDAPNDKSDQTAERFHQVSGHPTDGISSVFPDATLSAIVLEFGTYPPLESLQALLDDHWLTHYGDVQSSTGIEIKNKILEFHYPADSDWRYAVANRSSQVIKQTFRGL
jgi:hypothetical protein